MPAGRIASVAFDPASTSTHRCTRPSPPQAKTSSAPSLSACSTCFGRLLALRHLEPLRLGDALRLEHPAQLEQPAAHRLAGVRDDRDRSCHRRRPLRSRSRAARRRRRGRRRARRAARRCRSARRRRRRADGASRGTSATIATNGGIASATLQQATREPGAADARGEQQREAAVDGDRGRRVAGRIARVDRQVLEAGDVRPVAVDEQRRRRGRSPTSTAIAAKRKAAIRQRRQQASTTTASADDDRDARPHPRRSSRSASRR